MRDEVEWDEEEEKKKDEMRDKMKWGEEKEKEDEMEDGVE